MNSKYIQYGCGTSAQKEWRNFDPSPTLYFERLPFIGKLYTKNSFRFLENMEFRNIGFRKIKRAVYNDLANILFNTVEEEARWINCLGVECEK